MGTRATHVWTMLPEKNGTLLVTEESMEGWLVRLLKGTMRKALEGSLNDWLQSLKREAEYQSSTMAQRNG